VSGNKITLFSNGMAHVVRSQVVRPGEPQKVLIPFKSEHLSDAATSLNVFGKGVKLASPPSFTPNNADITSLNIDPKNVILSLCDKLSGSTVELRTLVGVEKGKLYGRDNQELKTDQGTVVKTFLVLETEGQKIVRVALDAIVDIHFVDEAIRGEISKALRQNFQRIKPDSTFVEMSLSTEVEGGTEAQISFTVPVAAWKMRYSIRQEGDAFYLEGAVVVDNNTDEDWTECTLSVVTGNPISFMTDIADITVPNRKMVNLVDRSSLGEVNVGEVSVDCCLSESMLESSAPRARGGMMKSSVLRAAPASAGFSNTTSFGMVQADDYDGGGSAQDLAAIDGVDTQEVGDFCIFTSKAPISVASKKSAVVPMFSMQIKSAGVVCYYKESSHPRRPYRAVKFKNEFDHTLGKGKVVVYNSGVFSGEAVMETTKKGENRILPHCLENGLKIYKENFQSSYALIGINISKSILIQEHLSTSSVDYQIRNTKNEEFSVIVEHTNVLNKSGGNVKNSIKVPDTLRISQEEKTNDGVRYYFKVPANYSGSITVTENLVISRQMGLGNLQIVQSLVGSNGFSIEENPAYKACKGVQTKIDELNIEWQDFQTKKNNLERVEERNRKNLTAVKDVNSASATEWASELKKASDKIADIEDVQFPRIQKEIRDLQVTLAEKIAELSVAWKSA